MKVSENKEHLLQSVIDNRKKTLPPILIEKVIFHEVLKDRKSRLMIYSKMRENIGTIASGYKDNTFKKWFLNPEHPIKGLPQYGAFDKIVSTMHFVLVETLMQRLADLRTEQVRMAKKIKTIEKYLPEYEQTIEHTPCAE